MFDDNTFDAKIVTPHPLDEGSIVYSLHPDPAGQCRAARKPSTRVEPEADRAGLVDTGLGAGRTRVTGEPSMRKAASRIANNRVRERPSSSRTKSPSYVRSKPTTAPQNPVAASSTTRSRSAATSGVTRFCLRV